VSDCAPTFEPPQVEAIIFARWIVPVAPANVVLEHHALVISEGCIAAIIPAAQAETIAATQIFRLDRHALMPGLVNAHGRAPMALLRGYIEDLPLERGPHDPISPTESKWVSEDFVRDGTRLAIAKMLRSGTTCFAATYFFPEVIAQTAHELGMRAQTYFPVLDLPSAWGQSADDYIHKGLQLRDSFKHSSLISIGFGPYAPHTASDATLSHLATLAAELDAPVQIHVHETLQEVDEALAANGERPLARLQRLGLLGPRTSCVHATALDADDIALLDRNNCHVVHCPQSDPQQARGLCPVEALRDAGINVALGIDGADSNNDLDLFGALRAATLLASVVAGKTASMPAHAALAMATLDGAKALGLDDCIGSLEIGKFADVIAIDMAAIEVQPVFDLQSRLVHSSSGSRVTHSWINGRLMLENRQTTTINLPELGATALAWQHRIGGTP